MSEESDKKTNPYKGLGKKILNRKPQRGGFVFSKASTLEHALQISLKQLINSDLTKRGDLFYLQELSNMVTYLTEEHLSNSKNLKFFENDPQKIEDFALRLQKYGEAFLKKMEIRSGKSIIANIDINGQPQSSPPKGEPFLFELPLITYEVFMLIAGDPPLFDRAEKRLANCMTQALEYQRASFKEKIPTTSKLKKIRNYFSKIHKLQRRVGFMKELSLAGKLPLSPPDPTDEDKIAFAKVLQILAYPARPEEDLLLLEKIQQISQHPTVTLFSLLCTKDPFLKDFNHLQTGMERISDTDLSFQANLVHVAYKKGWGNLVFVEDIINDFVDVRPFRGIEKLTPEDFELKNQTISTLDDAEAFVKRVIQKHHSLMEKNILLQVCADFFPESGALLQFRCPLIEKHIIAPIQEEKEKTGKGPNIKKVRLRYYDPQKAEETNNFLAKAKEEIERNVKSANELGLIVVAPIYDEIAKLADNGNLKKAQKKINKGFHYDNPAYPRVSQKKNVKDHE